MLNGKCHRQKNTHTLRYYWNSFWLRQPYDFLLSSVFRFTQPHLQTFEFYDIIWTRSLLPWRGKPRFWDCSNQYISPVIIIWISAAAAAIHIHTQKRLQHGLFFSYDFMFLCYKTENPILEVCKCERTSHHTLFYIT